MEERDHYFSSGKLHQKSQQRGKSPAADAGSNDFLFTRTSAFAKGQGDLNGMLAWAGTAANLNRLSLPLQELTWGGGGSHLRVLLLPQEKRFSEETMGTK